jgi:hypothetical protein
LKKVLFGLLIVSLLLTSPLLFERVQTELTNNTYEVMVPNADLDVLKSEDVSKSDIYKGLRDAKVRSITLEPETLNSLKTQGTVAILSKNDIRNFYSLSNSANMVDLPKKDGIFVKYLNDDHKSEPYLKQTFKDKISTINVNGKDLYFIEGLVKKDEESDMEKQSLGYFDEDTYQEIVSNGFKVVPRIENSEISTDEEENKHANNDRMVKQLLKFPKNEVEKVLFIGKEVVGYDGKGTDEMVKYAKELKANGYDVMTIEGTNQKGMQTFAKTMDYDVERLYSEPRTGENAASERLSRAVKERNIRTFLIKVEQMPDKTAEAEFKQMLNEIHDFHAEAPAYFHTGKAKPFHDMKDYKLLQIFAFLGGSIYLALAAASVHKKLAPLALVGGLILSAAYLILGTGLLLKGLALLVATAGPIWAILRIHNETKIRSVIMNYLIAAGIIFTGAWFVVSLLYGDPYLYKLEEFRGIKILLGLPVLVTALILGMRINHTGSIRKFGELLSSPVRYWHILMLGVVAVIGAYYLSRSGNSGTASGLELLLRGKLENLMFVRPRTKEFLIGFPFFVFGVYLYRKHTGIASVFLVIGAIGFASMMNTFTHLHIPLMLSVLRSVYGLVLGLVIGLIMIAVYKVLKEKLYPYVRERWIQ